MSGNFFKRHPKIKVITEPGFMKRIIYLLLIFSLVLIFLSDCEKEERKDRVLLSLQIGCSPEVFCVPGWYTDSIYYSDNQISKLNKYDINESEKNTYARLEYIGDEVKIFVRDFYWGSWRDFIHYTMHFEDGRILGIETNSNRVNANYFYKNEILKYILYYRNNQLTDSISVEYDENRNNICQSSWFNYDQVIGKFTLTNSVSYTYDDKNNPYRNSLHFLYDFYDCEEFSLDYFNRNNMKTVKSLDYELHSDYVYACDIHADYIYNENDYPVYITFYDQLSQVTDRNIITYNCR